MATKEKANVKFIMRDDAGNEVRTYHEQRTVTTTRNGSTIIDGGNRHPVEQIDGEWVCYRRAPKVVQSTNILDILAGKGGVRVGSVTTFSSSVGMGRSKA